MQLSKNFRLSEFSRSMTATRMGIDNSIPYRLIPNIEWLVNNVLQPLRDLRGMPIIVKSGYRTPALNSYIRSKPTSQHIKGEAADIDDLEDNNVLFKLIVKNNLPFDQLIWEFGDDEPEWIHVSCSMDQQRGEVLRAYKDTYGDHYSPFVYKRK